MTSRAESPSSAAAESPYLDSVDRQVLVELADEPRLSVMELARRIGVARATVQARLGRLTRRGVISGTGLALDVRSIGYPLTAFVALQIRQGRGTEVAAHLAALPEVLEIHTTAGTYDMLCRIAARSGTDLQRIIDALVRHEAIERSNTSIALSTPLTYRVLPLIDAG